MKFSVRRNMKHFSAERYREKLRLTDWDIVSMQSDRMWIKACSFLEHETCKRY